VSIQSQIWFFDSLQSPDNFELAGFLIARLRKVSDWRSPNYLGRTDQIRRSFGVPGTVLNRASGLAVTGPCFAPVVAGFTFNLLPKFA
jgi:hypothetical protein